MNILKPKTKQEKQIRTVIIIVIALILAYCLYKYGIKGDPLPWKKASQDALPEMGAAATTSAATSTASNSTTSTCTNQTLLKRGSRCDRVQWVQFLYNKYYAIPQGKTKLVEDGIFGANTEAAVKTIMGTITTTYADFYNRIQSKVSEAQTQAATASTWDYISNLFWPFP